MPQGSKESRNYPSSISPPHRCRYAERQLLVISSETKVPPVIRSLIAPQREIDELVAEVDKGGGVVLVRNLEVNKAAVGV